MMRSIVGVVVCGVSVLVAMTGVARAEITWVDYEDYTVIDHDTTWSGHMTRADIPKEAVVVNGATLTIAPGAQIEISRLSVYDGRIVALGTVAQPIHFTKQAPDYSNVPEEYAPYDRECYYLPEAGTIEFGTEATETSEASVFQHVTFEGMGLHEWTGSDNCPWNMSWVKPVREFFVPTAHAERRFFSYPAVKVMSGKVTMTSVTFRDNAYADIETNLYFSDDGSFYDALWVTDSNFSGNAQNVAVMANNTYDGQEGREYTGRVLLTNNWYGASSGPTTDEHPNGSGELVTGMFRLVGFSPTEFSFACSDCVSNVLFLPGLEASRLYDDERSLCVADKRDPTRAWEPSCNDDARKLYLDGSGKSIDPDIHTKEGDVLSETPTGANIYRSFLAELETMKSTDHSINDWQAVAYDWRLSLQDILVDGTIAKRLRELASTSKSGKVTIVAHSNGGLLAKALLHTLGDAEAERLVDTVVLVAVPQVGTPATVAGMLHGYRQNFFPVLDTPTARGLAENMPGAYQLLPTARYFSTVATPVATFDTDASPDWRDRYATTIDSRGELHDFLADTFRRVSATSADTETLATLNASLLAQAESLHDDLDAWVAPAGVRVVQIAGWGVPSTLASTDYTLEHRKLCDQSLCQSNVELLNPDFQFTIDGDGTVVAPSALWMQDVERYWVDVGKWNKDHPFSTALGVLAREHSNFFEIPEVRSLVSNVIKDESNIPQYIFDHMPSIEGKPNRLQYSLHSPLTLSLYDEEGRHTGVSQTGEIEVEIPGTYYKQFGDVKYIFADAGSSGQIVLRGYETGTFTLAIEELSGDTTLGKVVFQDMPTTPDTLVTLDVPDDLASASSLRIDRDGDGTIDIDLPPKIGEIVTLDVMAPVTRATLLGTPGTNTWYTSDVTVTLSATDEGSGVSTTQYSLDSGMTWHTYETPLTITSEGTTTLRYFSTDRAGKSEDVQTTVINIDKTAPEARIAFNPTTEQLDITGTDNLGGAVTVVIVERRQDLVASHAKWQKIRPWLERWLKRHKRDLPDMLATLTDASGHVTSIGFEKSEDRQGRIFVRVRSLGYDESETRLTEAQAQYRWHLDRSNTYQQFVSHMRVGANRVEARYLPQRSETWIMERPRDIGDADRDDDTERRRVARKLPGMVVPYLHTARGSIEIKY